MKSNTQFEFSPLTLALSPLRGEGNEASREMIASF